MKNEPLKFDREGNVPVEFNDASEAYYNESQYRLLFYDENYYHIIEADAKNEVVTELGGKENIEKVLFEIANTL